MSNNAIKLSNFPDSLCSGLIGKAQYITRFGEQCTTSFSLSAIPFPCHALFLSVFPFIRWRCWRGSMAVTSWAGERLAQFRQHSGSIAWTRTFNGYAVLPQKAEWLAGSSCQTCVRSTRLTSDSHRQYNSIMVKACTKWKIQLDWLSDIDSVLCDVYIILIPIFNINYCSGSAPNASAAARSIYQPSHFDSRNSWPGRNHRHTAGHWLTRTLSFRQRGVLACRWRLQ